MLQSNGFFFSIDKEKLVRLAQLYLDDFLEVEILALESQLETYIIDVRSSIKFSDLVGINDLAMRMVRTRRNIFYPLIGLQAYNSRSIFTNFNCKCGESFFYHEDCEDSTIQ